MKPADWIKTAANLALLVIVRTLLPDVVPAGIPAGASTEVPEGISAGLRAAWTLFNQKKIITLILALASIQTIGAASIQLLGSRLGAVVTGFLGGLISSTATTASLSRRSKLSETRNASANATQESLIFLCATLAMLFEAAAISILGTVEAHTSLITLFAGPVLATLIMIVLQSRTTDQYPAPLQRNGVEILPLLKLSAFIFCVLTLSKVMQRLLGNAGLFVLTFLVSLFEVHGAVFANMQLRDSNAIDLHQFGGLVAISILASYCSKVFLVISLGSKALKARVWRFSLILLGALTSGVGLFEFLI